MTALYLGIDFGTSGCRACVIDASGTLLAEVSEALPQPERHGEGVEQDARLWWTALQRLCVALPSEIRSRLKALAIDGTSGTVLLADETGAPLAPALMYNDARAAGDPPGLRRVQWLYQRHPDALRVHTQADWLGYRLSHQHRCDSNNALKLGWDAEAGRWPEWLADELPLPLLPEVVDAGEVLGGIRSEVADELGLPQGMSLVAGTTDSTAALIASGASEPGDAVTSLGSTLVLKVISDSPITAVEYGIYSQPLGKRWLVGGASNSGGAVLRQFFTDAQMAEMSAGLAPWRRQCLEYYPLPSPGERFPICDPHKPPRLQPRPSDDRRFFQGLLEGIARIEQQGYTLLAELGAPSPRRLFSVGGGSRNAVWTNYRLGLLGCEAGSPRYHEAAYGAALLARRGMNDKESIV